ncbi:MAG: (Fe-S)-binding protein [Bacilli bacterium]|nr:(Fe-S)-binding protein [Bacilli bacterium]
MLGILIFTSIAFSLAVILVVTNYYLNKEDKRVAEVLALLPGYNCGACGFGGCQDMAYNIVKEGVDPKKCRPMKEEQYQKLKDYLDSHNIKQS